MKARIIAAALIATSASAASAGSIGVSISANYTFLNVMRDGMQEAADKAKQPLHIEVADEDVSKQLSQVQNFIAAGVDALIVNAVDTSATTPMTQLAHEAGIPIVYVNHQPADLGELGPKDAYVGTDERESGTLQAKEMCRLLKEAGKSEAKILVIQGMLAIPAAVQRTQDIHDVIKTPECSFISVEGEQSADWDPVKAQDLMTNWITSGIKPDAVLANNDDMAIGAILAMKSAGWDMNEVIVGGIDATRDGLNYMKNGDLDLTVFQDARGQGVASFETAMKLIKGEKVASPVFIPFELVTPANMESYATRN
jgi:ABC-type sugar transport system substrate-binding protein